MNRKKDNLMKPQWFNQILLWREKHISEKVFVIFLAFVVGILTAFAAILLKLTIHAIQEFWIGKSIHHNYLYLILPPVGIFITAMFVKYIVRDDISHGVTKVLSAIAQRKSRIKPRNMWASLAASSITIGFGGSVGAESPIIYTGSAVGSNVGRLFRLEQKTLMLLVGCGAAGALAGIYKAPITGLVFVIEVLLMDLTMASILPLLVSSVTSASVAYMINGSEAMFKFIQTDSFTMERIPYALVLGILCGLISLYFSKVMFLIEGKLKSMKSYTKKFLISGAILSLLIFLFPPLYGEGYVTIDYLIDGNYSKLLEGSLISGMSDSYWVVFAFLAFALLAKVYASVSTNSGGGCGGLFAPSLFVGGLTGFLFSTAINYFNIINLPSRNFTLMGMAGVMAGVMHAPLTGVFLIAELTGGYNLFLPLMLVCISSFATIRVFMPHSIYSLRLAEEGKLLTHQKDKSVLRLMNVNSVIETEFECVKPEMTLGDMVQVIGRSKRNVFPVIDDDRVLMGVVLLDNIRNIMFRPELYNRFRVERFMVSPPAKLYDTMSMEEIMHIFDDTHAWNLPVVDSEGRYLGFISKSNVFNNYRTVLVDTFEGDE
ncbi:chloride channel protein [Falsiporphyromonas endometrii]|uniref:Chloride channel protein n=1 Tax=Falsiporphyromonas endometrii TaxID=1387297 RepID=A0ABV9K5S5_9PORP